MAFPNNPLETTIPVGYTPHADLHIDANEDLNYLMQSIAAGLFLASPSGGAGNPDYRAIARADLVSAMLPITNTGTNIGINRTDPQFFFESSRDTAGGNGGQIAISNGNAGSNMSVNQLMGTIFATGRFNSQFAQHIARITSTYRGDGTTRSGSWEIYTYNAGTEAERLSIAASGAIVINETGVDADVRIEGDTDANLLFTDASTDRVGIGTATPNEKLEVVGTIRTDALRIDQTPTAETPTPTHTVTINMNGTVYRFPCLV